ncbi:hypothetical protein [Aeromicrobium sp. REDSEA-S32_B7]|jgi:hypothetical protein|uniref:hypothetical protein n=1 Tax=Aeromicrobium sp. REDSEA-S32_B7 TaxID=1811526 RepID=UPI000B174009|nr:hypothetical protein [Aeromicrobium sp. REDSEA-S32_B7]
MSRRLDPLNTPSDWLCSLAANWKAVLSTLICIGIAMAWGIFSTTGTDKVVVGTVVRVEQIGTKQLHTRAVVELNGAGQLAVSLPNLTNCRAGSTIQLIRRENAIGRSFRAGLAACRN